jgi:hypothetical protein
MPWEKPTLREIRMDAEIGSYQNDFDERPAPQPPPRAEEAEPDEDEG